MMKGVTYELMIKRVENLDWQVSSLFYPTTARSRPKRNVYFNTMAMKEQSRMKKNH